MPQVVEANRDADLAAELEIGRSEQSLGELHWPNGTTCLLYSAEEPDRLRGPQCDLFWCDETGSWGSSQGRPNARLQTLAWDTHCFGARLGEHPHGLVSTTPSSSPVIYKLLERLGKDVVLTRGTSHENKGNLAETYWSQVIAPYDGTTLGRQEIYAEILDLSNEGFINPRSIKQSVLCGIFDGLSLDAMKKFPVDIGVDIAGRSGEGDSTVICAVRVGGDNGKRMEALDRFKGKDTMQVCGEVLAVIGEFSARSVRLDDTGIGCAVSDRLRELQSEGKSAVLNQCEIFPLNFSTKAFDSERFANLRSELWWTTAEFLRAGQIELLDDLTLQRELASPGIGRSSNGRLLCESKEAMQQRGLPSPDAGDALCLASYPDGWLGKRMWSY